MFVAYTLSFWVYFFACAFPECVLVWAGVELVFFTVASMGLAFGFAETSVGNIGMFLLLLSSAYTASRAFSVSHSAQPVRRLGVGKKLGGVTAVTADPS